MNQLNLWSWWGELHHPKNAFDGSMGNAAAQTNSLFPPPKRNDFNGQWRGRLFVP